MTGKPSESILIRSTEGGRMAQYNHTSVGRKFNHRFWFLNMWRKCHSSYYRSECRSGVRAGCSSGYTVKFLIVPDPYS